MNNQTVNELFNRDLDPCLFSITCFSTTIYFKKDEDFSNPKTLFIFFGCNLLGVRKFLTSTIADDSFKVSDWYNIFLSLKKRKLEVVLFSNIPDNIAMKKALSLAFPDITNFISCFEPINKIFKYYTRTYSSNVFNIIKDIYLSNDIDEYNLALQKFCDEFGANQFLMDLVFDDLKKAKNYYNFTFLLRKHVFVFYFFRDNVKAINSFSHSKHFFTSNEEFIELMLPNIKRIESRMYSTKSEWVSLLNLIYIDKKDLIKCYL